MMEKTYLAKERTRAKVDKTSMTEYKTRAIKLQQGDKIPQRKAMTVMIVSRSVKKERNTCGASHIHLLSK